MARYDPADDLAWLRSIADAQYPPPSPGVAVQQLAAVLANVIAWHQEQSHFVGQTGKTEDQP